MAKIAVLNTEITVLSYNDKDYIHFSRQRYLSPYIAPLYKKRN